jgi:hypothetical protein
MGKLIDITGKAFGKWTVLERAPSRGCVTFWKCRCECGTERAVEASSLRDGQSTNCGCDMKFRLHGGTGTPEYISFNAMHQRCKPDSGTYSAGVKIAKRWTGRDGFVNFLADMGPRPPGTTLDRMKKGRGYEPGNCRWATPTMQTQNRRNARLVTLDGEEMTLTKAEAIMLAALRSQSSTFSITTIPLPPGS